jgi:hypothetical protein
MTYLVRSMLVGAVVIALTFLPFVPGDYDPLAVPLSGMALILGRIALLLVPIGGLWLWASTRHVPRALPPRWLIWVTLITCSVIALVMTVFALASTGVLLATGTAAICGLVVAWLVRRLQALALTDRATLAVASALLIAVPLVVLATQSALIPAVTTSGRNRVIANGAVLIAEIEQYRAQHGAYPVSLLAVWGDYKPSIKGVERYAYEPSGTVYNVIFEEPSLEFGTRRFVVYNPHDEQRMTSHAQDRLQFQGPALEARRGYHALHALPQPHWKVFVFD